MKDIYVHNDGLVFYFHEHFVFNIGRELRIRWLSQMHWATTGRPKKKVNIHKDMRHISAPRWNMVGLAWQSPFLFSPLSSTDWFFGFLYRPKRTGLGSTLKLCCASNCILINKRYSSSCTVADFLDQVGENSVSTSTLWSQHNQVLLRIFLALRRLQLQSGQSLVLCSSPSLSHSCVSGRCSFTVALWQRRGAPSFLVLCGSFIQLSVLHHSWRGMASDLW